MTKVNPQQVAMTTLGMYDPLDETSLPEDRLFERLDLNRDGLVDREELGRAYRMGLISPDDNRTEFFPKVFSPAPRDVTSRLEPPSIPLMEDGSIDKVSLWRQRRREEIRASTQRADRSASPRGDASDRGTPRSRSATPARSPPPAHNAGAKAKPKAKSRKKEGKSRKEERVEAATMIQARFRGNKGRGQAQEKEVQIGTKGRAKKSHKKSQQGPALPAPLLPPSQSLLLLRFPDAPWPPPPRFEVELRNGLKSLGAEGLTNLDIKLVDGIIAKLHGTAGLLADLCKLPLYNLKVLGFSVGEVRPSQRGPQDTGLASTDLQAGFRGEQGRKEGNAQQRRVKVVPQDTTLRRWFSTF